MEDRKKKLPIGIENFAELRKEEFYYIDKTKMIKELLENWAGVNLFTRPRRFGKSLILSMLKCFFEPGVHKEIFDGLEISKETSLCEQYMGKFPVVAVSLKGVNAESYEKACELAVYVMNEEARRFQYLLESDRLSDFEKQAFVGLLKNDMSEAALCTGLKTLMSLLEKHHGQKVILLIDEYDVPLAKAFEQGYYDRMVLLIRNLFEYALKTNDSLKFAVLTGCMRISRESIFTGLNNLKVLSVAEVQFDEYFGFTDGEVQEMLEYYGLMDHYDEVREWYDGYQFGNANVYCPWDVINYCDALRVDRDAKPKNYWLNTSSNEAVKRFLRESEKGSAKRDIERLVAGEAITKEIHQELTYADMYDSIENLWSVLFTTGYLTQRGKPDGERFCLAIPNIEIRNIFTTQIMELFKESVPKNGEALEELCTALKNGDPERVERRLEEFLRRTISIRDTFVKRQMKENFPTRKATTKGFKRRTPSVCFYHGILLGILGGSDAWSVSSNRESGDGYSDILVETDDGEIGIVLELKYAGDGNLEAACREALAQIAYRHYEEELADEGIDVILKYGIAFYKKRCRVMFEGG